MLKVETRNWKRRAQKYQNGVSWGKHPGLLIDPKRGELAHIKRKKPSKPLCARGRKRSDNLPGPAADARQFLLLLGD